MAPGAVVSEFGGHATVNAEAVGQYPFSWHTRHSALSPNGLYVPAAHGLQDVPLGPVNPGLHTHCLMWLDMAGEEVLGGH